MRALLRKATSTSEAGFGPKSKVARSKELRWKIWARGIVAFFATISRPRRVTYAGFLRYFYAGHIADRPITLRPGAGEPASPGPNRRILAPDYGAPLSQAPNRPPAISNRTTPDFATFRSSTRSTAGPWAIMA